MVDKNNNDDSMIYMDYQSTTPVDERVLDHMIPYFTSKFGNPHSRNHSFGWEAEDAVNNARKIIANSIAAEEKDIIFTSGATEAANLAIKGACKFYNNKKHIIVLKIDHKCILDTCRQLALSENTKVTYLDVQKNGIVDLQNLEKNITSDTLMIAISFANSEIGVIQPIKEIGALCKKHNILLFADAAQAFGKIKIDVNELNIDLFSISGHKIYGPKGIGALYVRRRPKRVRLSPIIDGGGQERGLRSGTLPTPLIVGLGKAAELMMTEMESDNKKFTKFFDILYNYIFDNLDMVYLNGDKEQRIKNNLNISFACVEGESLMVTLKNVAVSSGSACTSASLEPSYVLQSLGVSEELAHTSIRFSFGRFTTEQEVLLAAQKTVAAVKRLREISPLWEMVQDGVDASSVKWGH